MSKQAQSMPSRFGPSQNDPMFPDFESPAKFYRDMVTRNVLAPAMQSAVPGVGVDRAYRAAQGLSGREMGNIRDLHGYLGRVDPALARRTQDIYHQLGTRAGGMGRLSRYMTATDPRLQGGYLRRAHEMLRLKNQIRKEYSTDMHPIARIMQDLTTPDTRRGFKDTIRWLLGVPTAKDLQRYTSRMSELASPISPMSSRLPSYPGR